MHRSNGSNKWLHNLSLPKNRAPFFPPRSVDIQRKKTVQDRGTGRDGNPDISPATSPKGPNPALLCYPLCPSSPAVSSSLLAQRKITGTYSRHWSPCHWPAGSIHIIVHSSRPTWTAELMKNIPAGGTRPAWHSLLLPISF